MIKYQLNITLYEKISLYSIRFDISLSRACCPGITEMPNGKMQCPGIRCVILLQRFSENWLRNDDFIVILNSAFPYSL